MSEMSPLGRMLLKILRVGTLFAAALIAILLGVAVWQNMQNYGFIGVMAAMLGGALWLAYAIGKELDNPGA
jgi:hypothetical protein